jgi:hypothetical protein
MAENTAQQDVEPTTRRPRTASVVINWVLALLTIPGAAAVVLFAYMQVLGTAGCTDPTCRQGPGELGFSLITYGLPVLAILTVAVSFVTARRPRGIVVPIVTWALLLAGVAVLILSFL